MVIEKNQSYTLEEIAKKINISRTTLYKYINNKGKISQKTQNIISKALSDYNYTPNISARDLARNKKYEISVINYSSADAKYFSTFIRKGLDLAKEQFSDNGLVLYHYECSKNIADSMLEAIDISIKNGIKNFIIVPINEPRVISKINELNNTGDYEVVLLNKNKQNILKKLFVGIDDNLIGTFGAELVNKLMPQGGNIYIPISYENEINFYTKEERLSAFKSFYENNIKYHIQLIDISYAREDKDYAFKILEKISKEQEIFAVFDLSFRLSLLSKTLEQFKDQSVLVGTDLVDDVVQYIKNGTIDALIFQDIKYQAYLAIKLLFDKLRENKEISQSMNKIKLEAIFSSNLQSYLDEI